MLRLDRRVGLKKVTLLEWSHCAARNKTRRWASEDTEVHAGVFGRPFRECQVSFFRHTAGITVAKGVSDSRPPGRRQFHQRYKLLKNYYRFHSL